MQDGVIVYCPIANHLPKMAGGCWVARVMNTSLSVGRGAQKAACWPWMAGYTLNQCEWTWTPSVTCQWLGRWPARPKLCSQRRGACPRCVLVQCQRPRVFLVLQILQHNVFQPERSSLPDVLSPTQRRRLAWWRASWEPGDRQQREQGHGGREHVVTTSARRASELYGQCMGLMSSRNACCCKRLQRRCCTWCALCSSGVPALCWRVLNLDYYVHRQLCKDLSEIQCRHHKSQEWFWFAKQLILESRTSSSVKS